MPQSDHGESGEDFESLRGLLEDRAQAHRRAAYVIGLIGLVVLTVAVYAGWKATGTGARVVKESGYSVVALVYELVRSAATAALLGAAVWGVLNLARASLDQATRYEKRQIAGQFLSYVLDKFEAQIKDQEIPLPDVMAVFKEWSDSVDTAFTHVRFGSKKNQALLLDIALNRLALSTGGAGKPGKPREGEQA